MSKNNYVYLNQIFDDVCKFADNLLTTKTFSSGTTGSTLYVQPSYKTWDYLDWPYFQDNYTWKYETVSIPSYPKSNYKIDKDGTSIIEIAISGFAEEEITIEKRDLKIVVIGKRKDKEKDECKYLYKDIATRDFEIEFAGSDKWNFDAIDADISKGILSIKVPMKEDCKPITIPIKKK